MASVVAQHSPLLSTDDKGALASLFGGDSGILRPIRKTLSVTADSVVCGVSNVDITARHCELAFQTSKLTPSGREANELGATLTAAGVPVEGAAGSMIEGVSKLVCMIELNDMRSARWLAPGRRVRSRPRSEGWIASRRAKYAQTHEEQLQRPPHRHVGGTRDPKVGITLAAPPRINAATRQIAPLGQTNGDQNVRSSPFF